MVLSLIDWLIVIAYMILIVWIGVRMTRRASGSMEDFFISGRHLPWWLIGTSMVASAFASDTPLFITNLLFFGKPKEHQIKSEALNPKPETNPNSPISNGPNRPFSRLKLTDTTF